MSNTTGDVTKTDASHESTWGASPEAKQSWDRKHGAAKRRADRDAAKEAKSEDR